MNLYRKKETYVLNEAFDDDVKHIYVYKADLLP